MTSALAPVQAQQRIRHIDVLRGVAVLGILAVAPAPTAFAHAGLDSSTPACRMCSASGLCTASAVI